LTACVVAGTQAATMPKPTADRQLNFQFYRNPAAIIADDNQQVPPQCAAGVLVAARKCAYTFALCSS
jgi:hypothetical protein